MKGIALGKKSTDAHHGLILRLKRTGGVDFICLTGGFML